MASSHLQLGFSSRGGGRDGASKLHHATSAIAAFSVEAYSTLEAESRAHLAAVAAAVTQKRREEEEELEENDEETAAGEVREREIKISFRFRTFRSARRFVNLVRLKKKPTHSKNSSNRPATRGAPSPS